MVSVRSKVSNTHHHPPLSGRILTQSNIQIPTVYCYAGSATAPPGLVSSFPLLPTPPPCMDSQGQSQAQPTRTARTEASAHHGRRIRDFRRVYKACELCRRKKIRCVVEGPGTSCLRCLRELTECVFSPERSHQKRSTGARPSAPSFHDAGKYWYPSLELYD